MPDLSIGVLAAPGLPAKLAPGLAVELRDHLGRLYPDVRWRVMVVSDGLLMPPATTVSLIAAHDRRTTSRPGPGRRRWGRRGRCGRLTCV